MCVQINELIRLLIAIAIPEYVTAELIERILVYKQEKCVNAQVLKSLLRLYKRLQPQLMENIEINDKDDGELNSRRQHDDKET